MYTRQLDCCLAHVYFTIDYYDDKGVHTQRQRLMGVRVGVVIQSAAADWLSSCWFQRIRKQNDNTNLNPVTSSINIVRVLVKVIDDNGNILLSWRVGLVVFGMQRVGKSTGIESSIFSKVSMGEYHQSTFIGHSPIKSLICSRGRFQGWAQETMMSAASISWKRDKAIWLIMSFPWLRLPSLNIHFLVTHQESSPWQRTIT